MTRQEWKLYWQSSSNRRQLEVLQMLASGATNAEIARELKMAGRTVKKYCSLLYLKYGISELPPHCKRARLAALITVSASSTTSADLKAVEKVIARQVTSGRNNAQIGAALGKTQQWVKNWLSGIYEKTGMGTRTELALWSAAKLGRLNRVGRQGARAGMPAPHQPVPHYFFAEGGVSPLSRRYMAAIP